MKIRFNRIRFEMTRPLTEPSWSGKVSRWYQLDGPALALTDLIVESDFHFDSLILASPQSCNETDREFITSGASRAQKFVHTLPNIRASMALQAIGKVCPVYCLFNGSDTLQAALEEWFAQRKEGKSPALVMVKPVEANGKTPIYEAWMMAGPHPIAEVKGGYEC